LSTRFADIFRNNSLKNGLLVVEIPPAVSRALAAAIESDPALEVTIDLPRQRVVLPDGAEVPTGPRCRSRSTPSPNTAS
jgi:3-isopropylmalate/(R)-2-methylmalate dehydratase small subunit